MKNIEEILDSIAEMEAEEREIPDVAYHVGAESKKGRIIYDAYEDFQEMYEENPNNIEERCYKKVTDELNKEVEHLTSRFGSVDAVKDPYNRVFLNALIDLKYCIEDN